MHIGRRWLISLALMTSSSSVARARRPEAELGPRTPLTVRIASAADSRGVFVDVRMLVDAPLADVERVVGDIDSYPDWVPNMIRAHVTARDAEPGSLVFETTVHLPWPLHDVNERLRMRRVATPTSVELSWWQVRGDLRRNEGRWLLLPIAPGQTEVRYQATFQLRSWIPLFMVRSAEARQAPKLAANLRARVKALRLAGHAASHPSSAVVAANP